MKWKDMAPAIASNPEALDIVQTVRGILVSLQSDDPRFTLSPAATALLSLHLASTKAPQRPAAPPSVTSAKYTVPSGPVSSILRASSLFLLS